MPQHSADATAETPIFRQIVDHLRDRVLNGELAAHAPLPSERSLAESFDVSRMTARRALEALDAEGLSYREDRKGRFVSPKRITYNISDMVSFAAKAQACGDTLDIELVSHGTIPADARLARALELPEATPLHRYTRLFRTDGHAAFLETEYVLASRFPDLLGHDLRQSSTRLLEQYYGISARTGDITIRMRAMQPGEASLLGLAPYHPGIALEQVIRDSDGCAFCFGSQIWRGELAEFSAQAIVGELG
ncbi:GntR family transcriptional regulator [Roseovarius sp.]|uniref:GntR family transcriptional regulator n=1 Tax=Roseovarius sp. TaxID=1486281 RepID=UPI000C5D119A|nr:GntR family transcriptional regulator [Roseovarius sp.]MAO27526.1 GntR family transcriptional regulator [Roseovarius sp.]MAZ21899.1 GntR family transcriptional regulator [Roseovarius sp.]